MTRAIVTVRLVLDDGVLNAAAKVSALFEHGTLRDAFYDGTVPINAVAVYDGDIQSIAEDLASLLEEVDNGMTGSWLNERDVILTRFRELTDDKEPTP